MGEIDERTLSITPEIYILLPVPLESAYLLIFGEVQKVWGPGGGEPWELL